MASDCKERGHPEKYRFQATQRGFRKINWMATSFFELLAMTVC
jgi:hypothetical protein